MYRLFKTFYKNENYFVLSGVEVLFWSRTVHEAKPREISLLFLFLFPM